MRHFISIDFAQDFIKEYYIVCNYYVGYDIWSGYFLYAIYWEDIIKWTITKFGDWPRKNYLISRKTQLSLKRKSTTNLLS